MADGSDIAEAKKAINCLVFAIDDARVLADVKRIMQGLVDEIECLRAAVATAKREALEEKLIDDAEEGLRGMVYQESDSGKWHPSYQDWVDLKEYVEPVLKLIAAIRVLKEKPL